MLHLNCKLMFFTAIIISIIVIVNSNVIYKYQKNIFYLSELDRLEKADAALVRSYNLNIFSSAR